MAENVRKTKIDRLIEALLTSSTIAETARKCRLSERTVYRMLAEDEVQTRLRLARQQAFSHGTLRIAGMFGGAIDILQRALTGQQVTKMEFLAAKVTIEAVRAIGDDDLERRIIVLERIVEQRQQGRLPP